jgi:hypothetical protein
MMEAERTMFQAACAAEGEVKMRRLPDPGERKDGWRVGVSRGLDRFRMD